MQADYAAGEEFSYVQFVGLEGNGMFATVDLPKLGLTFELPVFMIQGSEDLVTRPEVAKRYFDRIVAPQKEYVLLPRTYHRGKGEKRTVRALPELHSVRIRRRR
jgi:alpha-beta hydrolase superfamily lysophospholipase